MVSIVACLLKNEKAAPILFSSLTKLEYRGGDSVGMATATEDKINFKKGSGSLKDFYGKLDFNDLDGNYGIAHFRWATHGNVRDINSHPHFNNSQRIAVVHNGIIENYLSIKEELEVEGYEFKSDTDTEVIPHLLDKFTSEGLNLEQALYKTMDFIEGAYALAIISLDEPNKVVATRKDSPLIVGIGEDEYFLTSDVPSILKYTNNIAYLEDNEIVILSMDGVVFKDSNGDIIEKKSEIIDHKPYEEEMMEYLMNHYIKKQVIAIKNTMTELLHIRTIVNNSRENINKIVFIASETSFYASLVGKFLIENLAGIETEVLPVSEFKYSPNTFNDKTLAIFIFPYAKENYTLEALDFINKRSKTFAILNLDYTPSKINADYIIQTQIIPETSEPDNKANASNLILIYLLAAVLADDEELIEKILKVPPYIEEILEKSYFENILTKYYK
ncbi:glucosamine--fructose-6-phosphate aminotransferase (isomerizing) [Methanobrevibacter olleyae]|uniref:Glutamine--fructose-6-phosphate aminotransferase [isomerizing] n=1 Tax=Methanobrevibacter olleyae TaxID=294671 RepID=A0A1I4K8L5_METOL|nr:hypothetical protein [Methanobrevibacter olleyae]SFL74921.1 glucosamine--fructose-6-phosphate aminotransferase (isomerizing) [Methanobrevibacter olleyae]